MGKKSKMIWDFVCFHFMPFYEMIFRIIGCLSCHAAANTADAGCD
jgi:hypothetical protein